MNWALPEYNSKRDGAHLSGDGRVVVKYLTSKEQNIGRIHRLL
jgi:hypothetical protein